MIYAAAAPRMTRAREPLVGPDGQRGALCFFGPSEEVQSKKPGDFEMVNHLAGIPQKEADLALD